MRIGTGYDVHRLVSGRPLILGGVRIPFERGLDGHSDADVLAHAFADALLGAARAGDIGKLFPDTDPTYAGADSLHLLAQVGKHIRALGYRLHDADCTVIAQAPKLAPYREEMRTNLARALGVPATRIGIKATTTEWLGFTGRGEGMAAQAVVLLEEASTSHSDGCDPQHLMGDTGYV